MCLHCTLLIIFGGSARAVILPARPTTNTMLTTSISICHQYIMASDLLYTHTNRTANNLTLTTTKNMTATSDCSGWWHFLLTGTFDPFRDLMYLTGTNVDILQTGTCRYTVWLVDVKTLVISGTCEDTVLVSGMCAGTKDWYMWRYYTDCYWVWYYWLVLVASQPWISCAILFQCLVEGIDSQLCI